MSARKMTCCLIVISFFIGSFLTSSASEVDVDVGIEFTEVGKNNSNNNSGNKPGSSSQLGIKLPQTGEQLELNLKIAGIMLLSVSSLAVGSMIIKERKE